MQISGTQIKGQGHEETTLEKYIVRLFLSYFWTNFCETWLVYRPYLVHQPYEFSGLYAKCHGHSETK